MPSKEGRFVRPESDNKFPSPNVSDKLLLCKSNLLDNYVNISVESISMIGLVDTGADISVANPIILSKLRKIGKRVHVEKSEKEAIVTANNEKIKITGVISVNISIGNENCKVRFYLVPDLQPHIILGIDFLKSKGAIIDFSNRTVSFDKRRQLVAQDDFTIPAKCEKVIIARIKGPKLPDDVVGISSESPGLASQGLLAAKSMSHTKKGTVIHGVCNLSDYPITIRKNSSVGKFICLSENDKVFVVNDSQTHACVKNDNDIMNELTANIEGHDLSVTEKNQLIDLLQNYSSIFVNKNGKLGKCDILEHEINIAKHHKPIRQKPYKLGYKQKQVLENVVNDMLKQDIIEPSVSPWAAPCLLVAKKNNTEYRFVVDYRSINQLTELDAHPLPTTDDALETLGASQPRFFSVLDLRSGFYQSQIKPSSRPYTAWRCHLGLFQFKRLPMGLKNSPAMFQRLMETVLHGLTFKFCLIYLDDIIVYSKSFSEHLHHLKDVFDRLQNAGLKLHPQKCSFAKKEIKYLGHIVSKDGITPDPAKVEAIRNYPSPRNLKQLRAWLGMSGYYRKFQKNYARIAAPLYALTKKNTEFIWSEKCETAFQQLKSALTSPPILAYPQYDQPFRVYTDASSFAIGGILCQVQDGVEKVICYQGRALNKQEQNYGITEKECLALVFCVKKFDCYLRFSSFTAYVDHAALKWLLSLKEPTGKFARWVALLQSYEMDIVYRPGTLHSNADGVSRRTDYECDDTSNSDTETLLDILPAYHVQDTSSALTVNVEKPTMLPKVRNLSSKDKTQCVNVRSDSQNLWTIDELIKQQRRDPNYKDIIDFLESGIMPEELKRRRTLLLVQPFYFLQDNVLYHIDKRSTKRDNKDIIGHIQIAVPRNLVTTVLKETHDGALSGHLGISRTLRKTQRVYFWPSLGKDVANWVKACELCSQRKQPQN